MVFWTCTMVVPWCSSRILEIECKYNSNQSEINSPLFLTCPNYNPIRSQWAMLKAALRARQPESFWFGIALRSTRDYLPRPPRTPAPQTHRRTRTRDWPLSETTWPKRQNRNQCRVTSGCSSAVWRTSPSLWVTPLRKCHCFLRFPPFSQRKAK